jgi:hypothetical protein
LSNDATRDSPPISSQGNLQMTNTSPTTLRKRPLGVSLLVLMNAIEVGLLPLGLLILMINTSLNLSAPLMIFSGLFSIAVLFSCFQTWRGSDVARKVLLGLLTVHWGGIILNNLFLLFDASILATASQKQKMYTNIGRSALSLAINYWYFLGSHPRIFFKIVADGNASSTKSA